MKIDNIVETISGFGVPGLILLITISVSGLAGGAALTASLAILGGPFGMLGGIGVLGVMMLISRAISKYGFEKIYYLVLKELIEKGETKESIINRIKGYPISKVMKLKLIDKISTS
ncbi:hypothetical protein [Dokdonia sp. PRO95]|uniref:hypothetical protein n=1 Tax=Dokdonia sp. PRO95 TaxID=1239415 RepID=UPI000AED5D60|nr:hypothetical protein [Dokdonia sp. PRO95]